MDDYFKDISSLLPEVSLTQQNDGNAFGQEENTQQMSESQVQPYFSNLLQNTSQYEPMNTSSSTTTPFNQQSYILQQAGNQLQTIAQLRGMKPEDVFKFSENSFLNVKTPVQHPFQQPTFTPFIKPTIQSSNLIKIVEGFNKTQTKKQPGGRDNRHPIPKQVIELNVNGLPPYLDPASLSCCAAVYGYDRVRKSVKLGELAEKKFEEMGNDKRWVAVFDNLIIKFSSHLNGQKLSLRFTLLDPNKKTICYIDSGEFATITKRGKEKQAEREKRKRDDSSTDASVEDVSPSVGPVEGGQLVKITGRGFVCPPTNQPVVKFGNKLAREIHCIKRNVIICETPAGEPGIVNVEVAFEKNNFIPSNAKYQYVRPDDPNGVELLLKNLFKPNFKTLHSIMSKKFNKGDQNGTSMDIDAFFSGEAQDQSGYNALHYSCAHGFFELTCVLLHKIKCDIDQRDNYGRSPLFWAFWAGAADVVKLMISRGANISLTDEMNDTPLHIGAQTIHVTEMKDILFWLLAKDDDAKSNAKTIQTLLLQKNLDGKTPLMLAEENNTDMLRLLEEILEICKHRTQMRLISLKNIKLRSGQHINKSIISFLEDNNKSKLVLEMKNNKFIISILQNDVVTIKASINRKQIAFLIFENVQEESDEKQRVEFKLLSPPIIESKTDGSWQRLNSKDILNSCLAFVVETPHLNHLYNFVSKLDILVEFKDCFKISQDYNFSKFITIQKPICTIVQ